MGPSALGSNSFYIVFEKGDGTNTKYALHADTSNDEVSVQVTHDKIIQAVLFNSCLFVCFNTE